MIKKILRFPSYVFSFPLLLFVLLLFFPYDKIGRYTDLALFISKIPFLVGENIRNIFYKLTLISVGNNVRFKYGCFFQSRDASIGNNVVIGYYSSFGKVSIGNDVLFGAYINILSGTAQHFFNDPTVKIMNNSGILTKINIGDDVWVGSNSIIMKNIGSRCVVGAGSLVTKAVYSNTVVGGHPAKVLKDI